MARAYVSPGEASYVNMASSVGFPGFILGQGLEYGWNMFGFGVFEHRFRVSVDVEDYITSHPQ